MLHTGAWFILNYQIIDTNAARVSQRYYLDDYHVTEAKLQGFLYSLNKLKGTHVLCNPRVQGHHWTVIDGHEYSCYAYQTLDGRDLRFLQYEEDSEEDSYWILTAYFLHPGIRRFVLRLLIVKPIANSHFADSIILLARIRI